MYDWEEIGYDEEDNEIYVTIMYNLEWDEGDKSTGCPEGYMVDVESVTDEHGKPYDYNSYELRSWIETITEHHTN